MYTDIKLVNPYEEIGKRIYKQRMLKKISRKSFSKKLSIPLNLLEKIEEGQSKIGMDLLIKVSEILKVDITYFVIGITNERIQDAFNELEKYIEAYKLLSNLSFQQKQCLKNIFDSFPTKKNQ